MTTKKNTYWYQLDYKGPNHSSWLMHNGETVGHVISFGPDFRHPSKWHAGYIPKGHKKMKAIGDYKTPGAAKRAVIAALKRENRIRK